MYSHIVLVVVGVRTLVVLVLTLPCVYGIVKLSSSRIAFPKSLTTRFPSELSSRLSNLRSRWTIQFCSRNFRASNNCLNHLTTALGCKYTNYDYSINYRLTVGPLLSTSVDTCSFILMECWSISRKRDIVRAFLPTARN